MTQGAQKPVDRSSEGHVFGLGDVLRFLKSNALFIGLLTLLIAAAAVVVALLLPQQYSKQLTLDVNTVPIQLSSEPGQPPLFDDTQIGSLAVSYLQSANFEGVSISPTYNATTRQVSVALQSRNREALEESVPALVELLEDRFRAAYEEPLGATLEVQVTGLERELETNREALESVDTELERTLAGDASMENPKTESRVDGLEVARASTLVEAAQSEANLRELGEARRDLPRLAGEAVSVEVLSESEAPQSRSLVPVVILALMLGLVLAVLAAVARALLGKGR